MIAPFLSLNKGHPEKSKGTNIIAILPGTKWGTKEDRISVVGAHWDSVESSPGRITFENLISV